MQGPDQEAQAPQGKAARNQTERQPLDHLLRRGCLPGVARHPVEQGVGRGRGCRRRLGYLLVVLEPGIDAIPVEGDVAPDNLRLLVRVLVAPRHVLDAPAVDVDRPIAGVALERTMGVVLARLQEVHADILPRHVGDRPIAGLVHDQHPVALGHRLAAYDRTNPLAGGLDDEPVAAMGTDLLPL